MSDQETEPIDIEENEKGDTEETVNDDTSTEPAEPAQKVEKLVKLPMSRIKSLVKLDPEVHLASQEAVFLLTKAAELFLESFGKAAYNHTVTSKKKTIQKRDIDAVIETVDALAFLDGVFE